MQNLSGIYQVVFEYMYANQKMFQKNAFKISDRDIQSGRRIDYHLR